MKKLLFIVFLLLFNYAANACIRYKDIKPDSVLRMDDTSQYGTGADIDVDGDGKPDFNFMWLQFPGFGWTMYVSSNDTTNAVVQGTGSTQFGDTLAMPMVKDSLIGPASEWSVISMMGKPLADSAELGFAGLGDRYIGVRMKAAGGYKYGWILVNADTATATKGITVKAFALDYAVGVPIKAGDTGALLQNITVYGKGGVTKVLKTSTLQMETVYTPSANTNNGLRWKVSDTAKASISNTGLLTAKDTGKVVVTVTDTCSGKTDDTTINIYAFKTSVGAMIAAGDGAAVYPIPSRGALTIAQETAGTYTTASIVAIDGRVLMSFPLDADKTVIDISMLSSGTYTMVLVNKQKGKHVVCIIKD